MGNTMSQPLYEMKEVKTYCRDYQHSDIVNVIYSVLSKYQIEVMCECASWLLRELLIYKKYKPTDVEFICSTVNDTYHVFVLDKVNHYYIDITSEQFVDTRGEPIQPCMGSKHLKQFEDLGYIISEKNSTTSICKSFCEESCVLYDKGKPITRMQLLTEIKLRLGMSGGKRKSRKRKLHNYRKPKSFFIRI